MTREEAIKYLNEFILFKKISNTTEDEAVKCFKLAVDALQQQPSEDCISREAVLDSLHSYFAEGFNEDRWWNSTYVLDAINKVPSIQPQSKEEQETFEDCIRKSVIVHPKKGHWIGDKGATVYVNSEGNVTESVNCSECGEWLTGSDEYICGARYCPSCGIKMQEIKK